MKVRAIKTQIGDYGKKYPGDEFNVISSYGKSLIESGRAIDISDEEDEDDKEKKEIEITKEKKEVKHTSKNKK